MSALSRVVAILNLCYSLFAALITRIAYGIDVDKTDVDYLGIAEEAMQNFSKMFQPGKHLVESFPILRFLPSFFPGGQFKRDAAEGYPVVRAMRDVPWAASKTAMVGAQSCRCAMCRSDA